jgi:hypothetical protein
MCVGRVIHGNAPLGFFEQKRARLHRHAWHCGQAGIANAGTDQLVLSAVLAEARLLVVARGVGPRAGDNGVEHRAQWLSGQQVSLMPHNNPRMSAGSNRLGSRLVSQICVANLLLFPQKSV